jgi:serine/threonine protein kinase
MAPELFEAVYNSKIFTKFDNKVDIFSCGLVLYEIYFGKKFPILLNNELINNNNFDFKEYLNTKFVNYFKNFLKY